MKVAEILQKDIAFAYPDIHSSRLNSTGNGLFVATKISDYVVRLDGLLDFVPDLTGAMEPPRWLFGDADRFSEPAIITSIQPGMDNDTTTCTVTTVNYSEEIFTDDENEPQEEDVTWWE